MTKAMPTPALLHAISRLDQAISRAETALGRAQAADATRHQARETLVRQAIGELDGLIAALGERGDG